MHFRVSVLHLEATKARVNCFALIRSTNPDLCRPLLVFELADGGTVDGVPLWRLGVLGVQDLGHGAPLGSRSSLVAVVLMLAIFNTAASLGPDRRLHLLQLLVGLVLEHVRLFVLVVVGVARPLVHLYQLHPG